VAQAKAHQHQDLPGDRLSAADCRHYFDSYLRYRFGSSVSPEDFAREAGVSADVVGNLFEQKKVSDADFKRVADAINVSPELLSMICGYRAMPRLMRETLDRFFAAQREHGERERHPSHGRKAHAA
jgi:hypothetical protein